MQFQLLQVKLGGFELVLHTFCQVRFAVPMAVVVREIFRSTLVIKFFGNVEKVCFCVRHIDIEKQNY